MKYFKNYLTIIINQLRCHKWLFSSYLSFLCFLYKWIFMYYKHADKKTACKS